MSCLYVLVKLNQDTQKTNKVVHCFHLSYRFGQRHCIQAVCACVCFWAVAPLAHLDFLEGVTL